MIIRQEESTPIGDYFHDKGILKVFKKIEDSVDEFELDTEKVSSYCDVLIDSVKGLKSYIKKIEAEVKKSRAANEIADSVNNM